MLFMNIQNYQLHGDILILISKLVLNINVHNFIT